MISIRKGLGLLVALVIVLAGCDSNDPDPVDEATFNAQLTVGESVQEWHGTSNVGYSTEPMFETKGTMISMRQGEEETITLFTPRGLPSPGTYAIVSEPDGGIEEGKFVAWVTDGPNQGYYGPGAGTITLTASTPEHIAGSFSFAALPGTGASSAVSVEGTFDLKLAKPMPAFPSDL